MECFGGDYQPDAAEEGVLLKITWPGMGACDWRRKKVGEKWKKGKEKERRNASSDEGVMVER